MYLQPTKNHWAADLEADNLLDDATTIWCLCLENCVTGITLHFTDGPAFIDWLATQPEAIFVGHNFIAYDVVMLNRHWKTRIPASRVIDTLLMSMIYNPNMARPKGCRKGGHSLEAWGIRLGEEKDDFSDFSRYTPEMLMYCRQDTKVTALLYRKLAARMLQTGFTERGVRLEHQAWNIIQNKQRRNGFPLNKRKAEELYVTLRAREEELKSEIYKLWPPQLQRVATYKQAFKKDGTHTAGFIGHRGQFPKLEIEPDGRYHAIDYVAFNLGSPSQRIEKLLSLGWQPVKFTKKTAKGGGGNPQVDEDSLLAFAEVSGKTELLALAKWIVINSRANMVKTWLDAYREDTGAVHGRLFLAATLRYKHDKPNSANIPAVRLKKDDKGDEHIQYGEEGGFSYEARDLWDSGGDGWRLVGVDGTGIQNRCLIHNLTKIVGPDVVKPFRDLGLSGDIHKHNISVLGLANKAAAKKFYYTLMMGGGGARLAADQLQFGTKMTVKEGTEKRDMLVSSIPGFGVLIEKLQRDLEKTGRITLCDGTPILVSSPHMVIPYLLQGDESRLMKQALVFLDEDLRRAKLNQVCLKVADIHDEWQWRVRDDYVEQFITLALPSFIKAGESFDYLCPIEGDYKVGKTWAETH